MNHPISSTKIIALIFFSILILGILQPLSAVIGSANPAFQSSKFVLALTATSTPTPTSIYAIPHWQPSIPTPFPISTPDAKADSYQLATWNEAKAETALASLKNNEFNGLVPPDAYLTILEESFSRFPTLYSREDLVLELAFERDINLVTQSNPRLSEVFSGLGLWQTLLENTLNKGVIQPSEIADWLYKNLRALNVSSDQANNLFGDGKRVWTFNVERIDGYLQAILFVKEIGPEKYKVTAFSGGEWENMYRRNYTISIHDLNGNGIPEILQERIYWWYGETESESELSIYEWDGEMFVNLAPNIESIRVINPESEADQIAWTFELQADGSSIIVGERSLPTKENCPSYQEQVQYRWIGHSFEKSGIIVEPLVQNTSLECQIYWAYKAGPDNEDSPRLITESLAAWPSSIDDDLGPASQDFFHLWLADAYATQWQSELALRTLNDLIQNPDNSDYTAVLQMAKIYRKTYQSTGIFGACEAANNWRKEDMSRLFNNSHSFSPDDWQILLEAWGFGDSSGEYSLPCNFVISSSTLLKQYTFASKTELVGFFSRNQIQWNGLKHVDLDGDGLQDWLVVIKNGLYGDNELWALIQGSDHTLPILISSQTGPIEDLAIAHYQFYPEDGSPPVQIYRAGSEVVVFQIITKEEKRYPFIQFTNYITNDNQIYGMELLGKNFMIYTAKATEQYQWNAKSARFELLQEISTKPAYQSFEELLFIKHDTQAIIQASKRWQEPKYSWEVDIWQNSEPYYIYLLGLAYELSGDEENAVQIYWQLWHDFPDNPYTIIARQKLLKSLSGG